MKKFICIILLLALTGCSKNKEDIKVYDADSASKYVKFHYGEASITNTNEINNEMVVYTFLDKEYNFEYTLTSQVECVDLDGCSGLYDNKVTSDFSNKYHEKLLGLLRNEIVAIENEYNVKIADSLNNDIFYFISESNDNVDKMLKASYKVNEIINKYDKRNYLKKWYLYLQSSDKSKSSYERKIGIVYIKDNKFKDNR